MVRGLRSLSRLRVVERCVRLECSCGLTQATAAMMARYKEAFVAESTTSILPDEHFEDNDYREVASG